MEGGVDWLPSLSPDPLSQLNTSPSGTSSIPSCSEHVQQLRPVVHAVRDDVGDAAGGVSSTSTHRSSHPPRADTVQAIRDNWELASWNRPVKSAIESGSGSPCHWLSGHQVRPHLDVEDDVLKRLAHRPVTDVERPIKLLVRECVTTPEQQVRCPRVVSEQAIKKIHLQL